MKKALFLHGFLGNPQDGKPFFSKGYEWQALDLRRLVCAQDAKAFLEKNLESYEIALGYSFGGRVLSFMKRHFPHRSKKWVYVSSRHTPYDKKELKERVELKNSLLVKTEKEFWSFWDKLNLFSGFSMDRYRKNHDLFGESWEHQEIKLYLEKFFIWEQPEVSSSDQSFYIYGEHDKKYAKEAQKLNKYFYTYRMKGLGHRCLYQAPQSFKELIQKIG